MKLYGFDHHRRDNPMDRASPAIVELYHMLAHIIGTLERFIMAISPEVQKIVDDIAANTSIAKSSEAALALLATQIKALQDQIAALQAGGVLSPEDKAALVQGAADLEATNTALQAATPASTPAAGG